MLVVYMAHPVAGDVEGNLRRARQWVRWLEHNYPVAVVATWITECEIWDDGDPLQREAGMARNFAVIEKCDAVWLVGGRLSNGMAREREHALLFGRQVHDLLHLGQEPPR